MTRPIEELLAAADALKVAPLYGERKVEWERANEYWHLVTSRGRAEAADELAHRDALAIELAEAVREMQVALDMQTAETNSAVEVCDELRAEVERLKAWQPIKTAPKDGTEILAWHPQTRMGLTFWNSTKWYGYHLPEDQPTLWMSKPVAPEHKS